MNREVSYKKTLSEYIRQIFQASLLYPEINYLVQGNKERIEKLASYDDIAKNDLLLFLAINAQRVENFEKSLEVAKSYEGYASVQKDLKDNIVDEKFWDIIAEVEAANFLIKQKKAEFIEFPKANNKTWDIKYRNDEGIGYVSVKNWNSIDLPFHAMRKEIMKRSLYNINYRNKFWNVGIDYSDNEICYYFNQENEKKFSSSIIDSVKKCFDELEANDQYTKFSYSDKILTMDIDSRKRPYEFPGLAYGWLNARSISDSMHFFHFGRMYARFIGLCHSEYRKLSKQCDESELKNSRLLIFPNLGLSGWPYSEEIEKTFDGLVESLKLDEIMKVDIIRNS